MPDTFIFEYAMIRMVPRVEREEFFNVGVILFCKGKKFLDVRYTLDRKKLEVFSTDLDFEELNAYLHSWKLICEGAPSGGAIGQLELSDRFRWLTACRSTMIQSSETHSGLCIDPQHELEQLFKNFVL